MSGAAFPDFAETVVCAMRPAGSWLHLLTLAAFVGAAWAVRADRRPATPPRTGRGG